MTVYTIGIPILQSIITIFVIVNFALATFVNPGVIPKGNFHVVFKFSLIFALTVIFNLT